MFPDVKNSFYLVVDRKKLARNMLGGLEAGLPENISKLVALETNEVWLG